MSLNNNKCLALAVAPSTRQRIEHWLQLNEHEVLWVSNASELLAHPELDNCPLVFMHVAHPETLEACRIMRARAATAMTPQVVLTNDGEWRTMAYEAGVDAGFMRSTTYKEIHARLQTLLRQKQFLQQWLAQQVRASEAGHERVHDAFRRYVSPQLVERILTRSATEVAELNAGQRLQAAVLFADMRGFTGLAERLAPTQVFELLNEFFAVLTSVAFQHAGTVFNMAGDSLMVGFGVPIAQPDAGIRAVLAARDMLSGFAPLARQWQQRYDIETGLGIGINEGEVVAGNIGSEQYMNYTLIGDTVNISARLSQRARAGEVLFSNALKLSLDAVGDRSMPMIALPPLTLRGRSNPIDIYCVPTDKRIELPH
ncbi:MAG: adenylate/guanylate cyclase domain-containing protein [Steroidobacteraceae bacterium]